MIFMLPSKPHVLTTFSLVTPLLATRSRAVAGSLVSRGWWWCHSRNMTSTCSQRAGQLDSQSLGWVGATSETVLYGSILGHFEAKGCACRLEPTPPGGWD